MTLYIKGKIIINNDQIKSSLQYERLLQQLNHSSLPCQFLPESPQWMSFPVKSKYLNVLVRKRQQTHFVMALCAKVKIKKTTSCFKFLLLNILCLHHECHDLRVFRLSTFDLVLSNMASSNDPGEH